MILREKMPDGSYQETKPAHAKKLGRHLTVRPDWNAVRIAIMLDLCWQKFHGRQDLATKLRSTGQRRIIEANTWGDQFWGMTQNGDYLTGRNMMGRILEAIRDHL